MNIAIAKSAGFCFGIKRALKIALAEAKDKQKVYMLGDIVHNEDVLKEITEKSIKKIKHLARIKNKTLLIRTHGTLIKTYSKAKRLGYKIIDRT